VKLSKTPAEQHEFNLRRFNCYDMAPLDSLYAAAQFIKEQAAQLAAADARNKILEAELVASRAAYQHMHGKYTAIREHVEQRWAEQDANRTALLALMYQEPRRAA